MVPFRGDVEISEHQVVVVGAGPAGVSAALALKDAGLRPLVLDQAEQVGSSWRGRYDRLRLNSPRPLSHLPGRCFPKRTPMFPTRDQMIEHLQHHAHEDGIALRLGTRVDRIARDDGYWVLHTDLGEGRCSWSVPAARGWRSPTTSPTAARRRSGCRRAHRRTSSCAKGQAGSPATSFALALLRLPVRLADAVARFGRRMDLGDLSEYGLPVPDEGVFARFHRLGVTPSIVDKEVIEAIKAGRIEVLRGVESLDPTGVRLDDGAYVEPDAVICATGYRRGLEPLVGHLDVLGEHGAPRAVGERPAANGLRFIGYVPRPSQLGYMGKEAKRAANAIARELRTDPQDSVSRP